MIWCVDHDAQRRNLEINTLRCVGMDAKGFPSAASFWEALQAESPDLVPFRSDFTYEMYDQIIKDENPSKQ